MTDPIHPNSIRVLVADDHMIVRMGLVAMINDEPDMSVCADVGSGGEALEQAMSKRPDLILLDLRLPDGSGTEFAQKILYQYRIAKIVILTSFFSEEDVYNAFQAGVKAYLLKDTEADDIVHTLRQVYDGSYQIPSAIGNVLARRTGNESLSSRELETLRAISAGKSNKEIASDMGVAENTVKNHVKAVLAKLDVRDRTQAVTEGLRRGIIRLPST